MNPVNMENSEHDELLQVLQTRFEQHLNRHSKIEWTQVRSQLESQPDKVWSLNEMERTGGEPDVVTLGSEHELVFIDCSPETPAGRRNLCYDLAGQAEREKKGIHPAGNALTMAQDMGIEVLTETQYRELQKLGEFDLKTSSWLLTPNPIRNLGGALFGDRRYDHVFVYHNGAGSFYAARGFRGILHL